MYWDKYAEVNKSMANLDFGFLFIGIVIGIVIVSYLISKMATSGKKSENPGGTLFVALVVTSATVSVLMIIGVITYSISIKNALLVALVFLFPTAGLLIYNAKSRPGMKKN